MPWGQEGIDIEYKLSMMYPQMEEESENYLKAAEEEI
jgi:hypothetical protein